MAPECFFRKFIIKIYVDDSAMVSCTNSIRLQHLFRLQSGVGCRDCNPGIPGSRTFFQSGNPGIMRPNPGISGLENNVLTLLLRVKCMH